jgi:hypothetical protein
MKNLLQTLFFFLLVTQICFGQWVQLGLEDKAIKDIAARNSNIFVITSDSGSVYRSTDNGNNWTVIVDTGAVDIAISPSEKLFLSKKVPSYGYFIDRLFSSTDNGNTWDTLNVVEQLPPNPGCYVYSISVSVSAGGIVFCGLETDCLVCIGNNVAISTDNGLTWTTPGWEMYGGQLFDFRGQDVITTGGYHCVGGGGSHNYLSFDNGQTWMEFGIGDCCVSSLNLCLNGNILSGRGYENPWTSPLAGLMLSTDSCKSWTKVSCLKPSVGISIESGGILAGSDSLGVFLFNDDGDSLGSRNDGLTNLNIHTLTIDNNNYVYAGTDNGVWRRPLSEITAVGEEQIEEIPTEFLLSQNYPNPFNPTTTIKYSVPQVSQVQIKIFDVLGNEIETLVNEEKQSGTYELTWYAASLSSGVYFYQLKAGEFIQTKKMLLMK